MLLSLHIRDFVLVDQLSLDFHAGFTVLTGETGAGKSILLDALGLALGAKGEAGMIRQGADKTEISAEFQPTPQSRDWLQTQSIDEEETLILRRTLDHSGRSKAFVNGSVVTLTQLRALSERLVDIHGQHAHQSLLKPEAQRALLDEHAQQGMLVKQVAQHYQTWQRLAQQLQHAQENASQLRREREQLEWQIAQISQLDLAEQEWETIQLEQQRLAHAAQLLEAATQATAVLTENDEAVIDQLQALIQRLQQASRYDNRLQASIELLEAARIHAQEASYALTDYSQQTELDPQRLVALEQRMQAIYDCSRKLRLAPETLLAQQAVWQTQLAALHASSDLDALTQAVAAAEATYRQHAQQLSQARATAAATLAQAVTTAMQTLNLNGGQCAIHLAPRKEPAAHGLEDIEFLFAGHAGVAPRPLSKVASGGELARISLALSVITSEATPVATLIFDEVDSGIGGAVAEVVGQRLAQLGEVRQVLCVTHLAQVAAQGQHHFMVKKTTTDGQTRSQIQVLTRTERVEEIARMLGGVNITPTTRQHAQEMLQID
ncbi:DNA repair protein RecN [Parvibium lacunae]|uniref:DNA repair protein RecN n=1 Tax=Parvibium lacunae TaxID=1888893 RepID=A0A368L5C9_9BURK|nr:DNA repair protein RecN [Parvibium lacunae]RCS58350.1 DNA repair protein RecN [Parvibium lacunae]